MTGETARVRRLSWALVGFLILIGLVLRLLLLNQSGSGDEMSTLWIVKGNDLAGVVSAVYSDAEISPPFYFLLAKLSSVFGATVTSVRLPSVIAGIAVIPVFYLLGLRTLGRKGALLTAAVASLSPFLVYFSANARAYSVMTLMIVLAALALVVATSENGRWWHWLGWSVASALAVYSHYVGALAIGGQVLWALICFPRHRLKVLGWGFVALLLFSPWLGGFRADLDSPTSEILQALQQSGLHAKADATWPVFFLRITKDPAPLFWDRPDLLLGLIALLVAAVGIVVRLARGKLRLPSGDRGRGVLLGLFMTGAVFAGELLMLALGTDIYGTRNLAPVWAGLPLVIAAICVAAGPRAGTVAAVLVLAGFTYSSVWLAVPTHTSIDYRGVAELIESRETPGGVVLDGSIVSPAPQTPLDAYLHTDMKEERLWALKDEPDFIKHIFDPFDAQEISDRAFSGQGPVELVTLESSTTPFPENGPGGSRYRFLINNQEVIIPGGWEETSQTEFKGLVPVTVTRFERVDKGKKGTAG